MRWFGLLVLTLGIMLFLFLGCENYKDEKFKVEQIKNKVEGMENTISELETRVVELELSKNIYEDAFLDVSVKGYQRIDTNCGFFLISIKEAKPYLDGYKIILNIGNPSTIVYSGFTLKVKWGKRFEKGEKYADWSKSLKEKEEKFTQELRPGVWNKIELVLSPAKPEQLGYLKISMKTDVVKLSGG